MAWVLLADDRLLEVAPLGRVELLRLGDEVSPMELGQGTGDHRPGILIGRGATTASDVHADHDALPPTRHEMEELIRNVQDLGNRLARGPSFDAHFRSHRNLLETALGKSYPISAEGESAFLLDLGQLISTNALKAIGIATVKKGEPMVYVYSGQIGSSSVTAVVRPSGEWVTLLAAGAGLDLGLMFQMRFDRNFPFPFLRLHLKGGFERKWY